MKRVVKSALGVTLLEIMLVLAVAAMIIVMSVRYYQSANASQQANQALALVQVITASADSLAQASGDYTNATKANITPLLSNVGGWNLPWGSQADDTAQTNQSVTVTLSNVPTAVCPLIRARLVAQKQYSVSTCNDSGVTPTLTITYSPNA